MGNFLKLISDIEKLITEKPDKITLRTKDAQRLIDWARKTGNKRRNSDTQKLRCVMYRAAQSLRAVADRLDDAREAK